MKRHVDHCRSHNKKCCSGFGFATLLIIAGILLLCTKLNLIPTKYIDALISWQIVLIIIGLLSLIIKHLYAAVIFATLGIFFIIPKIGLVPDNFIGEVPTNFVQLYWPILLIIAGVLVVIHRIFPPKHKTIREHFLNEAEKKGHKNQYECENGFVNKRSLFESGKHIVLDPEFKGGNVKTVFGETKMDLRKTSLPEGNTQLIIDVSFGSVVIYVPTDWRIQLNVNSVFGTFEDKRAFQENDADPSKTLVISGSVVFGEGSLKN